MSYQVPETEAQAKAHLEAMSALIETDGWDIFESKLRAIHDLELSEATEATDPAKAMKHLGAARAMKFMLDFPAKHIDILKSQLAKDELPKT